MRVLATLLVALLLAGPARATDCPPAPSLPSPEELTALQAAATDHGVLWKLKRDGRASWLYGSLHVGRLSWAFPGPALMRAWSATDVLAVELDMSDPQTLAEIQEAAKPDGTPLPPALARRLAAQGEAACVPAEAMSAFHPLLQLSTLTALAARRDGLDPSYGQDVMLAGLGHASGRPVVALETARGQMQVLLTHSAKETLAELDEGLTLLEQDKARTTILKLAEAWSRGDLNTLAHYEDWCDCVHTQADRDDLRRLNDDRNGPIAGRIAALHASGKRVLAVVGALHMTGKKSLPKLLAAQGFELERVQLQP
jgi:uncharacterized protein YbaP (TraB family)